MSEWTNKVTAMTHRGLAPDAHRIVAKIVDEVCGLELRVGSALGRRQKGTKLENERSRSASRLLIRSAPKTLSTKAKSV